MITSNKQYTAARQQLAMLTASLASEMKDNVPGVMEKAGKAQLQALIDEIQQTSMRTMCTKTVSHRLSV